MTHKEYINDLNNLSIKDIIETFNQTIDEMIKSLNGIFMLTNMNGEFNTYSEKIKTLVKIRRTAPIDNYIIEIFTKYGTLIDEDNIDGLMNIELEQNNKFKLFGNKFLNLKKILVSSSDENKKAILQYLKLLNAISTVYLKKKFIKSK